MSGMYLRECLIENVGPITSFDVSLGFDDAGNPKPVILVGKNGTGKTNVLAYILDALAELAKLRFSDVVKGQQRVQSPLLKTTNSSSCRSLCGKSLSLLKFSDSENRFSYVEKVGQVNHADYATRLGNRFEGVKAWLRDEPFHRQVTGDEKRIESFFISGAICFFPSSRHEIPHWLNQAAVQNEPLFREHERMRGMLEKPIIVERAAESTKQWIMDVLLDSLVDGQFQAPVHFVTVDGQPTPPAVNSPLEFVPTSNLQDKHLLKIARDNVETVLHEVLEDTSAQLVLNYRSDVRSRIAIRLADNVIVPSLRHLSAGQSLLFNLFATIIRYADRVDLNKSFRLNEIEGVVLVDEIEAHLHADLQYQVLPRLIRLFPKVQFILTSHSPLFLLGMERKFGTDGIEILEMPIGRRIGIERFDEFRRSFDFYRDTTAFEDEIDKQVLGTSKPLVLTEGETDALYLQTAVEVLGYTDLGENLAIEMVGKPGKEGATGSGKDNLDSARRFLEHNHTRFPRRVLLLYDCDTSRQDQDIGQLVVRKMPNNPQNTKITKGIENLLPVELFEDRFYQERTEPTGDGGHRSRKELRKKDFCEWICQRRNVDHFRQFDLLLVPILRDFAASATPQATLS
jgi:hypothetical protein